MRIPVDAGTCWAKMKPRRGEATDWHPLLDHSIDVAACAESLLGTPIIRARLVALAATDRVPNEWIARLTVLAFLHDFGKANLGFQERRAGHIKEAAYVAGARDRRIAAGLDFLDHW